MTASGCRPGSSRRAVQQKLISCPQSGCGSSIWETLSHTTGRLHRTEMRMRKARIALLGMLTMMSAAILAVPTEAAERSITSVQLYKIVEKRLSRYPYGGTYPRVHSAKRRFGYPYVSSHHG